MKSLSLKQVAAWTGGKLDPKYNDVQVRGVNTDSREVKPGQLFIPLAGTRVDGHNFIGRAMDAGAAGVLTARPPKRDIPAVRVRDTLEAFGQLAAAYRASLPVKVIAITGSVGKTTTKEMLAAILRRRFRTTWTEGNHNNNLGLPMSIMDIEPSTEVSALELGMNHFGEISYLTKIARPNMAIFTNIGTMHIEYLGSRAGILKAKLEILEGMGEDGIVVMNGDEPLLWDLRGHLEKKQYYFGVTNAEADVRASNIVTEDSGVRFTMTGLGKTMEVFVPSIGQHTVYNALAAAAAALLSGAEPEDVTEGLAGFQNAGMRQRILSQGGYTIIDDCYNAGPESMAAALEVLASHSCKGRRIAVLGDMMELGCVSSAEHYRIGRLTAEKKIDMVLAYGANASRVIAGAITGGVPHQNVCCYDDQDQLVHDLRARVQPGDVLLFKGSRGMKMERALKQFLADYDD